MTEKPLPEVTEMNRAFFEGTALGELRVRRCPRCDARFRFAHEWCPECWSLELGWEKVSGLGTVTHFSVVHHPPSDAFETPYVIALVTLDVGVRVMGNILGCEPDEVRIGLPVRTVFEERGSVFLPMFVPDPGQEANGGAQGSAG